MDVNWLAAVACAALGIYLTVGLFYLKDPAYVPVGSAALAFFLCAFFITREMLRRRQQSKK